MTPSTDKILRTCPSSERADMIARIERCRQLLQPFLDTFAQPRLGNIRIDCRIDGVPKPVFHDQVEVGPVGEVTRDTNVWGTWSIARTQGQDIEEAVGQALCDCFDGSIAGMTPDCACRYCSFVHYYFGLTRKNDWVLAEVLCATPQQIFVDARWVPLMMMPSRVISVTLSSFTDTDALLNASPVDPFEIRRHFARGTEVLRNKRHILYVEAVTLHTHVGDDLYPILAR